MKLLVRQFTHFSHHVFELQRVFYMYLSDLHGLSVFQRLSGLVRHVERVCCIEQCRFSRSTWLPRVGETTIFASFLLKALLGQGKGCLHGEPGPQQPWGLKEGVLRLQVSRARRGCCKRFFPVLPDARGTVQRAGFRVQ